MFLHKNLISKKGFTLVEMVLATTIFAIMSTMVISIYMQTTSLSARLKATRYLSETAREITERIAEDVKERGLSGSVTIPPSTNIYWNGGSDYTQSGTEILGIWDGSKFYLYGIKDSSGINPCIDPAKSNPKIHCGLYIVNGTNYAWAYNLVDSFVPEEGKKRVKIRDLKFYVSWDGNSTERKVTLVFVLALMPRIGVPNMNVSDSTLRVQTTISERFFKQS